MYFVCTLEFTLLATELHVENELTLKSWYGIDKWLSQCHVPYTLEQCAYKTIINHLNGEEKEE